MPTVKKVEGQKKGRQTSLKQWDVVRSELEAKVATSQEELSGMRKWCLAALGEAEKRTAAVREQAMTLQRRLSEETRRAAESQQLMDSTLQKLQEEKKLKLMVYGQTLTKHKEMAEEISDVQEASHDANMAREHAEQKFQKCHGEKQQLISQLANLEREFQLQLTKQHEDSTSQCAEYEDRIQALDAALAASREERSNLETVQSQLETTRASAAARVQELERELKLKENTISDARAEVAKLTAHNSEQASAMESSATEKQELQLSLAKETEAERHLSDRVAELAHLLQAESDRLHQTQRTLSETEERLHEERAKLREQSAKRELAQAEAKRLLTLQDLPAKLIEKEAVCNDLQVKLGSLEAQREVSRASCNTWKEDHARLLEETRRKEQEWRDGRCALQNALKSTTEQCEARVSSMQLAMEELVTAKNKLESEVSRMNEESIHCGEARRKADQQIDALQIQVQDLENQYRSKEAEVAKFGQMTAELTQHIGELETSETKRTQLLEASQAERQRLSDELKVASQQLDMLREVTRQLYAKTTEQVRAFVAAGVLVRT
eukprot:COSAG05_NODE_100_length_19386_cov_396.467154_12_plen_555_part_00